jgi:subtilisin family serine protease
VKFRSLLCSVRRFRTPVVRTLKVRRAAFRTPAYLLVLASFVLLAPAARAGLNVMPLETDFMWKSPGYVPDELLVKFKSTVPTVQAVIEIHSKGGWTKKVLTADGLIQVKLPAGTSIDAAIDAYSSLPDVEYATPNLYAQGFFVPNDSLIHKVDWTWNLRNIGAYAAWDVVPTASPSIRVGVLDTGVAFEDRVIPEYERSHVKPGVTMYRQSPELPGPFMPGYDFVNNDPWPNDDHGHGTFVSTILAGKPNNIAGAAGIAYGVTILPVKVLRHDNGGEMAAIIQGIRFAADQGVDIMNMSLGFPPVRQLRERGLSERAIAAIFNPLQDAVRYAQSRGAILVAAAGNFGYPDVSLPAGYSGVISVASTRPDNRISSFSSWGFGLSFVAPGGDFTDINEDHLQDAIVQLSIKPYRSEGSLCNPDSMDQFFFFGTSAAAPQVTGAVALLMTQGVRSQGRIESILRATAIQPEGHPNSYNPLYGNGLIQIDKAVQLAAEKLNAAAAAGKLEMRVMMGNPSPDGASISFRTESAGVVQVSLFDVSGRLVRRLDQGRYPAGERQVRWDGKDDRGRAVGSGVYYFRVATPDGIENRSVVLLR